MITPIREDGFSKKGLREILDVIREIKDEHDLENVKFLGTFLTQVDPRTIAVRERIRDYQEAIPELIFKTYIRRDTKIAQIESSFVPMLEYSLDSNALIDYCNLLLEMGVLKGDASRKLKLSMGEDK